MVNYILAEPLGTDLVLAEAEYEGIRLCRAFCGEALQSSWSPPSVTVQKRAIRAEVMNFLRNAPAMTASAVTRLSPVLGKFAEFLPLKSKPGLPRLFALNALVVVPDLAAADGAPVFRLKGQTSDVVYFSEAFKQQAEDIGGPGVRFVAASQRYARCEVEPWAVANPWTIKKCAPAATSSRIAEAEHRTGLRFPESLRWLFAHANGAQPARESTGEISSIATLRDGRGSAEWTYELLVIHFGLVPWTWFPFADAPGGDVFFVDCSTPDGAVYLCLHDTAWERIQPFSATLADFVATIATTEISP